MNVKELLKKLKILGIDSNGTEWEVYYSERGNKRGLKKFILSSSKNHYLQVVI